MAYRYSELDRLALEHIGKYDFLTISQCGRIFHKGKTKAYEVARKQLNKLCEMGDLKKYKDNFGNEYIFILSKCNKNISFHRYTLMNLYSKIYELVDVVDYFEPNEYWKTAAQKRFSDGHIIFTINKGSDKEYKKAFFIEIDKYNDTKLSKYEEIYEEGVVQDWYLKNMGYEYFPDILIIRQGINKDVQILDNYSAVFMNYIFENLIQKIII